MAITYTRTTLGSISDLTATASTGGSLTASTQFWFVVVPITAQYYVSNGTAFGGASNIATATTDATYKTIDLSWTAVSGAYGYLMTITKTGYESIVKTITLDAKTDHNIALKSQIPKLEDDNGNVFDRVDKTNSGTTSLRRKLVKV